jgi:hypothetical protein
MLAGNELRLECLKLALCGINRATSSPSTESHKKVMDRAQAYLDFVTGRTAAPGFDDIGGLSGPGTLR